MELREGLLFSLGNLLLDITAVVEPRYLEMYNLLPNNSTLAQAANVSVFDEIQPVSFSAGGSALNTLRIVTRILKYPKACTLMGAVGRDENAEKLIREATKDGVNLKCQGIPDLPTGRCAVLVNRENRSLLTQLGAAQRFSVSHLLQPENFHWVEAAQYFYITGYFLMVSFESVQEICKYSHEKHRPLLLNINATWVTKLCKPALMEMIPYLDVIFGNEEEFRAMGDGSHYGTDISKIALALSQAPNLSSHKLRSRIIVITRGSKSVLVTEGWPTLLGRNNALTEMLKILGQKQLEFPVTPVPTEKIVDSNGAGDAFVGGFLAEFIRDKSIEDCVNTGMWVASQVLQQRGCNLPF